MKKKLLRYSLLMLMMLVGGASSVWADDSYTITFNEWTGHTDGDSSQKIETISDIINTGASYVSAITTASNVYLAREGRGIKLGTSSKTGTLVMALATPVKPSKITFKARQYGSNEAAITVNGLAVTELTTSFDTYTVQYDGNTEISSISISTPEKRAYITEVTVYTGAAGPDYYVVGDMTEWEILETYKMTVNPSNSAEYMLTKQFAAGNELKVKDSNDNWYPSEGGNYKLTKDGTHTIYFRPDGQGGDGWFNGYIYVDDSQATEPEPQPTVDKYYLTGSFNGWVAEDAYEMTLDETSGKYTITTDLTKDDEIKVMKVDGRATYYYPDGMGNGYIVQVTGSHTIVFDPTATGTTAADYFTVSDDEEVAPQPTLADGYYLVGAFNEWTPTSADAFTANPNADGEYMITKTLTAGQGIKVIGVNSGNWTWYPAQGDNYIVNVTGEHTVYFRPAGNSAWPYNYLYVADDEPTAGAYELTSVSDNGTVKFFVDDEMVTSANENAAVTFTIEPNEGYVADDDVLVEAYVNFEDAQAPGGLRLGIIRVLDYTVADGVYSFTMPAANARVTVTYSVDKSELEELIEDAEELLGELPADSEAAEDLQDAIDDANNVLNNPDATAQDVADAIEDLQDAIDAAEEAIAGSTIEVTVPAEGFVTMYLEDNSKLMPTREAGVKLYTVASVDAANEEAVLSSELTIVKGKTPFLLYNETTAAITAKLIMASGTPDAVTPAEEFQGTLTAKTFTADDLANYDHYVLSGKNFYWAAEPGTIPANRCWIQLAKDSGAPAQLAIVFEGGTTGINNVERGALNVEGCYTLDGRRVANPTSGLYIINGKKVVIK